MRKIVFNKSDELNSLTTQNRTDLKALKKDKTAKGIYLIVIDGKKYVGSAYGSKGLYGRWNQYINYFKPESKSKKNSKNSKNKIGEELREFHKGNFNEISFEVLETIVDIKNRWEKNLNCVPREEEIKIVFDKPEDLRSLTPENSKQLKKLKKVTAKGVYLITIDDKEYILSAYGKKGLYGKWNQYINYFKPDSVSKKDSEKIKVELRDFHKGNFNEISFKVLEMIVDSETKSKEYNKSYHVQTGNKDASANGLNMN